MTLSPAEQQAVEAAVPAWIAAAETIAQHNGAHVGPTADEILAQHGITFGGTRARYLACERAIRREANARLGHHPDGKAHNSRRTADARVARWRAA